MPTPSPLLHTFSRPLLALCTILTLAAAGRDTVEARIEAIVRALDIAAPEGLRFRISAEPAIDALVLWDATGQRIFPPEGGPTLMPENAMLAALPRLEALREDADPVAWDRAARNSEVFYRCSARLCLAVNGAALMEGIGREGVPLSDLLEHRTSFPWGITSLAALAAIAAAVAFRRQRSRAAAQDPGSFLFGGVRIDPNHMIARVGGHRSDLTARDLKLIARFRANEGTVLSKDQLYEAGWGRDYLPNSRALEQHILMLRRKLDPGRTGADGIETVHGHGYRFRG